METRLLRHYSRSTRVSQTLQDDVPLLYRGHAAFLFTSRYEAWGLPVMEAMASGLPVVATRCLGLAAFAEHGYNCLLADVQACAHHPTLVLFLSAFRAVTAFALLLPHGSILGSRVLRF
jgi:glycosyltransferase involved in cell wall biosynthesis